MFKLSTAFCWSRMAWSMEFQEPMASVLKNEMSKRPNPACWLLQPIPYKYWPIVTIILNRWKMPLLGTSMNNQPAWVWGVFPSQMPRHRQKVGTLRRRWCSSPGRSIGVEGLSSCSPSTLPDQGIVGLQLGRFPVSRGKDLNYWKWLQSGA